MSEVEYFFSRDTRCFGAPHHDEALKRLFPVIREKKRLKQRLGIAQTIDFRR